MCQTIALTSGEGAHASGLSTRVQLPWGKAAAPPPPTTHTHVRTHTHHIHTHTHTHTRTPHTHTGNIQINCRQKATIAYKPYIWYDMIWYDVCVPNNCTTLLKIWWTNYDNSYSAVKRQNVTYRSVVSSQTKVLTDQKLNSTTRCELIYLSLSERLITLA